MSMYFALVSCTRLPFSPLAHAWLFISLLNAVVHPLNLIGLACGCCCSCCGSREKKEASSEKKE
eukprot:CAMPEP_0168448388 /NCGR_PEP_ID=MMETSP0228-20121227/47069_1 /TAXON_ID=133427 /ORGANISM="Protoceratium reticulatum, Strain CCCM 535 (=CCMP 1889)" /LENGTH=63 /DNA_ID=CAMNT_0008462921 /DNA_START=46 /DNA_END=234 /DNA_ORIENTATION=+